MEEAIKLLEKHIANWKWLIEEGVCEREFGLNTITALEIAIKSMRTMVKLDEKTENAENIDLIKELQVSRHLT